MVAPVRSCVEFPLHPPTFDLPQDGAKAAADERIETTVDAASSQQAP